MQYLKLFNELGFASNPFDECFRFHFFCVLFGKSRKNSISSVFRSPFWKLSVFLHPNFSLRRNEPKVMTKEQEYTDTLTEELIENEKCLLLINDDVNTFEYVIDTLMKVCHHTREQAETCAWITHYKGKCAIMHGTFEELKPYYDILLGHQLTVKITD